MNDLAQAIIKENKVCCPNNHHNYRIRDYKAVSYKGMELTEFKAICKECGQEFSYLANIGIENTQYYNFVEDEIEEMRED